MVVAAMQRKGERVALTGGEDRLINSQLWPFWVGHPTSSSTASSGAVENRQKLSVKNVSVHPGFPSPPPPPAR